MRESAVYPAFQDSKNHNPMWSDCYVYIQGIITSREFILQQLVKIQITV